MMPRLPVRPLSLNPEHLMDEFAMQSPCRFGDNCKSGSCPEHGLWPSQVSKDVPVRSASPALAAPIFIQPPSYESMRTFGWADSTGADVSRWPDALSPSATVIITESFVAHGQMRLRVLLHQRADNHGWGFLGGRQEIGESIMQCAIREAYEESGLQVTLLGLVCVDSDPVDYACCVYPDGTIIQYTNCTFLASASSGTLRRSHESLTLAWFWEEDMPKLLPAHSWRWHQAQPFLRGTQRSIQVR